MFFNTEVSDIIAETTNNFSHDHFELLNFILAKELTILEAGLFVRICVEKMRGENMPRKRAEKIHIEYH